MNNEGFLFFSVECKDGRFLFFASLMVDEFLCSAQKLYNVFILFFVRVRVHLVPIYDISNI